MAQNEFKVTRKASLGGLDFSMQQGTEEGDNRIADHGYPKRNDHYLEDMGREAEVFNVSGHVDVDASADSIRAFRRVLQSQKAVSFYHPFYAEMYQVRVDDWRISSDTSIGRVEISFRAYKTQEDWEIFPDTSGTAGAQIDAIAVGLSTGLNEFYQPSAFTATIASDACDLVGLIDSAQSLNFEADRLAYRQALQALGVC